MFVLETAIPATFSMPKFLDSKILNYRINVNVLKPCHARYRTVMPENRARSILKKIFFLLISVLLLVSGISGTIKQIIACHFIEINKILLKYLRQLFVLKNTEIKVKSWD